MGASKQIRDSAQAASEKHPTTGSLPVAETYLSVRLWNSNGADAPTPLPLESDSPVVSLTKDLIAASKGAAVSSRDGLLVTSFHAVLPAVSTARRLQWAVQGLAEGRDLRGTSIAVLIHYAHDLPVNTGDTAVRSALDQATPGQILLTESIGKSFDDLPGFPSKALDKSGLRELLWRAPEAQSTRSFDEQILTQLLEQQGLQDDLPEEPEPIANPVADRSDEADSGERAQSAGILSMAKSPLGIGIASAAVLLVGGWFIFHSTQAKSKPDSSESAPAAPSTSTPTTTASPGYVTGQTPPGTSTPANPPNATVPNTAHLTAAQKRALEREEKEKNRNKPEPPKGSAVTPPPAKIVEPPPEKTGGRGCDLEPGEYGKELEKAQNSYSRGHYDQAARQFSAVVKCEPGNAQAKEGLVRAQSEMRKEN